jgi:lipopolysaccharide biosynthesis regulator YciM
MKTLLLLFGTLFTLNLTFGQNYEELRILWVDQEYEKLLKIAERYTFSDKTKNDAEPYLWLAKGLYSMSKDEEFANTEKFKKSFNDALTWLGKYYKKDKNLELYDDHLDFFLEIKQTIFELIETDISSGNYSKASSNVTKILKVSPKNIGQYFLLGAINFNKDDKTTAKDNWKKADEMLAAIEADDKEDISTWELPDRKILALGMMESAKCHSKKKPELTKSIMEKGMKWLDDIEFFTEYYDEIK